MHDLDVPPDGIARGTSHRLTSALVVSLFALSGAFLLACSSGEPATGTGGAPPSTGGAATGGRATGGAGASTGGRGGGTASTGGSATGGTATGGNATGGNATGGNAASGGSGGKAAGGDGGRTGGSAGGQGGRAAVGGQGGVVLTGGRGGSPSATGGSNGRFVFTAFTNESESNMYVYASTDGLNFKVTKGPAYMPPSGLVRDPSVLHHSDGYYYVVYTTDWSGANFGVARSRDLLTWTFVTNVPVGVSGVTNTWAPEWFRDPDDGTINVIVSLSKSKMTNFTPHRFRAMDDTLTKFATAVQMQGIGPNYIDTFIVKVGGTYHNFSKNETTKYIEHGTASNLDGPYTFSGTADWARWGKDLEGPTLFRMLDGSWRIFMDGYANGHYYYSDSTDLQTWTQKKDLPGSLSGFVRHGTVLPE